MNAIADRYGMDETALAARLTKIHADYERWLKEYDQLDYSHYRQAVTIRDQLCALCDTVSDTPPLLLDYLGVNTRQLQAMLQTTPPLVASVEGRLNGTAPIYRVNNGRVVCEHNPCGDLVAGICRGQVRC